MELSDQNLKENITPISNSLDKVKALSGNTFTWKTGSDVTLNHDSLVGNDIGVIAQEVEALGLVGITTNYYGTEYKAVRYDKLIPILIEAIKELSAKVDALS
tara:strand:- start:255 stop:560 length:306 start_codon:yes stop_codon:yes gene_type:complete